MSHITKKNFPTIAAFTLALFLAFGAVVGSLLVKGVFIFQANDTEAGFGANASRTTTGEKALDHTGNVDSTNALEEFDPELRYKTQFFIVDVPPSWKGRWTFKETTSEREAWSQIESYYFAFILDGEAQFELGFTLVGLGSILPYLGSANGYSGHIFSDNLTIDDRHYIIDHLILLNQETELPNNL